MNREKGEIRQRSQDGPCKYHVYLRVWHIARKTTLNICGLNG